MLAKPREALALAQGVPTALRDPRLSRAGNWLAKHLTQALEALVRVENWLRTPNERELPAQRSGDLAAAAGARWRSGERGGGAGAGTGPQTGEDAMNEALRHEIVQRRQAGHVDARHRRGAGHLARRGGPRAGAGAGAARRPGRAVAQAAAAPAASSIRSSRS